MRLDPSRGAVPGAVLGTVAALGFSISLVLARYSYDFGTNALTVLLVRFGLMAALSATWCLLRGEPLFANRRIPAICYLVGLSYFAGIGSYLHAVAYIPVSLAVLLFYTFPLITALLAALRARRLPQTDEVVVLLIAFAGIALALDLTAIELHPLGIGLALLAALGVAANLVISEQVLQRIPMAVFIFHLNCCAAACAALATIATGSFSLPEPGGAGQLAFGVMLVAFIVAFLANYNSVRLIGSGPLAMILNLEPVATIAFALALLGEAMSLRQFLGAAVVIVVVAVAQGIRWRRHRAVVTRSRQTQ